ncbi:MAG: RNA polymerase sigma factor [Actinobacteria bacterium]|nr:RNA polymerase sigma factor [Actinomycetota bacterium]
MAPDREEGPPDTELVRRFCEGDEGAFATLVRRHERRVYNLAYRMIGRPEDARDATQEAFLSCYRHLGAFRGDSSFTTWIHRITVNACYDILRKKAPVLASAEEQLEPPPAPDHADAAADAVDVQRALLDVPAEFRSVLVMHDVQGLPYEEIAQALGVPLGTVKSRLHRARVALGRSLSRRGEPREPGAPSNPRTLRGTGAPGQPMHGAVEAT